MRLSLFWMLSPTVLNTSINQVSTARHVLPRKAHSIRLNRIEVADKASGRKAEHQTRTHRDYCHVGPVRESCWAPRCDEIVLGRAVPDSRIAVRHCSIAPKGSHVNVEFDCHLVDYYSGRIPSDPYRLLDLADQSWGRESL
ncbi:hypothetical protein BDN67DRAFT_333578 [Paxillus ammoniavirescens]|nr:hypothetical protein BDN67DRAFT_333578 [Paxillus ammoniavirescens]